MATIILALLVFVLILAGIYSDVERRHIQRKQEEIDAEVSKLKAEIETERLRRHREELDRMDSAEV